MYLLCSFVVAVESVWRSSLGRHVPVSETDQYCWRQLSPTYPCPIRRPGPSCRQCTPTRLILVARVSPPLVPRASYAIHDHIRGYPRIVLAGGGIERHRQELMLDRRCYAFLQPPPAPVAVEEIAFIDSPASARRIGTASPGQAQRSA
jgi:hypothetical protein